MVSPPHGVSGWVHALIGHLDAIERPLPVNTYNTYASNEAAVTDIESSLREERPVALGMDGHWMAATDIRDGKNGSEVLIHDSWTGKSDWVPLAEIADPESNWSDNRFPGAPGRGSVLSIVVAGEPGQPAALNPDSVTRAKERDTLETVDTDFTRRSDTLAPSAE